MLAEGIVGIQSVARGATTKFSLDGSGGLLASKLLPRLGALALNGRLFYTVVSAVTVTANHASPLTAGTGTPIIGLANPINSGRVFCVIKYGAATTSATTPGGPFSWNTVANVTTITGANAGTVLHPFAGGTPASAAKLWNNTAVTGSSTGVAHVTALAQSTTAPTGNNGTELPISEPVDGALGVTPNNMLALTATAAGTADVISAWLLWAEIDIGNLWG